MPYITSWSTEHSIRTPVIARGRRGIAYQQETRRDRDSHGVLWIRYVRAPGLGEPQFRLVHPYRQRHAMRRLLCQLCAGPADHNDQGILWLLGEAEKDWPGAEITGQPPICLPCAAIARRACPHLRRGTLALRVRHAPIEGVYGTLYWPSRTKPTELGPTTLPYTDPRTNWLQASQLMRGLYDCTVVDLDTELAAHHERTTQAAP